MKIPMRKPKTHKNCKPGCTYIGVTNVPVDQLTFLKSRNVNISALVRQTLKEAVEQIQHEESNES